MSEIASHLLSVVLVAPEIPPNVGNVARTCAVTGTRLVLVEPLAFELDDKHLWRAGLDYWNQVSPTLCPDWASYRTTWPEVRRVLFSARASTSIYDFSFRPGDHLVFGGESQGLSPEVLADEGCAAVGLPMLVGRRSLNLATAVGIALYEALRQLGAFSEGQFVGGGRGRG